MTSTHRIDIDPGHPAAAVLLAAGEGKRMGGPKALLDLGNGPAVRVLAERLREAGLDPVVAVVNEAVDGALGEALRSAGSVLVVNRELDKGPLHSVRLGLAALPASCPAALILPVDFAGITVETLHTLAAAATPDRVLLPVAEGRRGHPPVIGRRFFPRVHTLPLDGGLRGLYGELVDDERVEIPVGDPAIHWNLNTPDDLERLRSMR